MHFQTWRLHVLKDRKKKRKKSSPDLLFLVYISEELLFGCAFVWSSCLLLEIIWLICFVCRVMLNVPFKTLKKITILEGLQVLGHYVTKEGEGWEKKKRERGIDAVLADSYVINQASTTLDPSLAPKRFEVDQCLKGLTNLHAHLYVHTITASMCRHFVFWPWESQVNTTDLNRREWELGWCKATDHVAGL